MKCTDNNAKKCVIDHILDAQWKGEINEDNVLYIIDNLNVAGRLLFVSFTILVETKGIIWPVKSQRIWEYS